MRLRRKRARPAAQDAGTRRVEVGDVITTDLIDGYTLNRRRVSTVVTAATDQRAEFDGGRNSVWDQSGTMLRSGFGTHTPGQLISPADLAVGKKWRTAFQTKTPEGRLEDVFWEYRAVGFDSITVPGGTYRAIFELGQGESLSSGVAPVALEARSWLHPESGRRLRHEFMVRQSGKVTLWTIQQEVAFQRLPRP